MRKIYHLLSRADWESSEDPYRAASLDTEGFIHCSSVDQVAVIANLFYADAVDLSVLIIDADRLGDLLRDEAAVVPDDLKDVPELNGLFFPHVYGPIPRRTILDVRPLRKSGNGRWTF